jgi:hypothetical protein
VWDCGVAARPGTRRPRLSDLEADRARQAVVEAIREAAPATAWALEDAHTRATVQPAIWALRQLGLTNERQLARVRVRDLVADASQLAVPGGHTVAVPPRLRTALLRQRLHACIVGQRPSDQLLTFDGSATAPSALLWYRPQTMRRPASWRPPRRRSR